MVSLKERMASLRAREADSDPRPYSDSQEPAPLSLFLALYEKAATECYLDYMEGAKCLHLWLTSGGCVPVTIPEVPTSCPDLPRLLGGYELSELVAILVPDQAYNLDKAKRIQKAIYFTLVS